MDWHLFITIALALIGVIAAVAWADLWRKGKKIWENLLAIKEEYHEAAEDGQITDEERLKIADKLLKVIEDAADIWQALTNLTLKIISIIKTARAVRPAVRAKPKDTG